MAHETGSVNSLADLLTAIRAACTDNGWTLSTDVLHKGDTYIRIQEVSSALQFLGGNGIDGSDALTTPAPQVVRIADFGSQALTFPMTWEAHINTDPDEVYIVVNYNVDYYQYAAWGISEVPDLPGSGVWFGASRFGVSGGAAGAAADFFYGPNGAGMSQNGRGGPLFFSDIIGSNVALNTSFIHHDLDGQGWSSNLPGNGTDFPFSFQALAPLLTAQPNEWNDQTVLLPYPVYCARSSGNKVSLVADLKHIRHCRIPFHDPGDIITLGSDQWKLYPWYRKNTVTPGGDSSSGTTHSGTGGFAVRYTGS